MKRAIVCVVVFLFLTLLTTGLQAQEAGPSLGDLARRERERKKGLSQPATQTVTSEAVGLRLTIPAGWKATENRNPVPVGSQLVIECMPEHDAACMLLVESAVLPSGKTTITDADRQSWDKGKNSVEESQRLSSRDIHVAGHPAHEVVFQDAQKHRSRRVYVAVPEAGRVFEFYFYTSWDRDIYDDFTPAIEAALQSLAPVGQPSAEERDFAELAAKWTPEEQRAHESVFHTLFFEEMCKGMVGKFVAFEQMVRDCKMGFSEQDDPRRDPNYDFHLTLRGAGLELSAIPRRAGLGGFFSDGRKVYYNAQGPASNKNKALYDLSRPATTTELAPAAGAQTSQAPPPPQEVSRGKKVYTEEDLKNLRGTVNVAGGETSTPSGSGETSSTGETAPAQGEYKREEEVALRYVCSFRLLEEFDCSLDLHRFCTLEELAEGIETKPGKISGFKKEKDPRLDRNYEYHLDVGGENNIGISAIPRKPGLGGFFTDTNHYTRYNPRGQASNNDKRVRDGVGCVGLTR